MIMHEMMYLIEQLFYMLLIYMFFLLRQLETVCIIEDLVLVPAICGMMASIFYLSVSPICTTVVMIMA